MPGLWHDLPAWGQDTLLTLALLLPACVAGALILRGYAPRPLVAAILWRFRWANLMFVALITVSVGMGIGLLAQERGLRQGSAQAADKFDLVVTAPGSELTMILAAVYLQPADVPLLDGETYNEIAGHERVAIAAPLAFGDSYAGHPVVGTTADFVRHLTDDRIEGRMWGISSEAIAGADVDLAIGDSFVPAHGHGAAADPDAHAGVDLRVVGRMGRTGSPWDRAILVPVESVWEVHGLANGHAPERADQLGPPFDARYFPGTPAIIVQAEALWANYALRSEFTRDAETMAFFPGAVLANLYRIMGDVRQAMSLMSLVTQILVAASVLLGLVILTRLFQRQMALLRALGAPDRFVLSVVWAFAALLLLAGAVLGLGLGVGAAAVLSQAVSARTGLEVTATLGWSEIHLVAGFVSATTLLAILAAWAALKQSIVDGLRA